MVRTQPVRKVSKRQAVRLAQYAVDRVPFLAAHARCQRCWAEPSTEVHHSKGRVGELLLNQRWWIALCHACHQWVTDNPKAAKVDQLSFDRLAKTAHNDAPIADILDELARFPRRWMTSTHDADELRQIWEAYRVTPGQLIVNDGPSATWNLNLITENELRDDLSA